MDYKLLETSIDYELFEKYGWTVECESPLEIRHEDGSFATQQAAWIVYYDVKQDHDQLLLAEADFRG